MIMIVLSFALVKFYAFAILYVLIVMQIKLVVVKILKIHGLEEISKGYRFGMKFLLQVFIFAIYFFCNSQNR